MIQENTRSGDNTMAIYDRIEVNPKILIEE
jgi:hypothetical protein